jgi:hypothetical protein
METVWGPLEDRPAAYQLEGVVMAHLGNDE